MKIRSFWAGSKQGEPTMEGFDWIWNIWAEYLGQSFARKKQKHSKTKKLKKLYVVVSVL